MEVGDTIRTKVSWPGVPKGTFALVVEDYGTGFTVAWDLKERPLQGRDSQEIMEMSALDHEKPLTDGFDKKRELHYLELI